MKKSLLALAVVSVTLFTNSSIAATVYDKDGTTLAVGGRVQSVFFNGQLNKAADHDSSLVNSARLNLAGSTKLNDYISVLAFTEWDLADGHQRNVGDNIKSREQYVGVDFGNFGRVIAGKTFDATRSVTSATDQYETLDIQNDTGLNGDRRTGIIRYDINTYGVFLSIGAQIAADNQSVFGKKYDLNSGYSGALGYTFDNVVFGPLSFKVGYNYLEGQNDRYQKADGTEYVNSLKNARNSAASIAWGSAANGLYLSALYYVQKVKFDYLQLANKNTELKRKCAEFIGGYGFDNGIGVYAAYNYQNTKNSFFKDQRKDQTLRKVPLQVKYTANANFKAWAEIEFDANSDSKLDRGTEFTIGARYTF